MRAVDTNVIVRLVLGDDPRQVEAAEAFVAKGAWVSHVAIVETVWVLDTVYGLSAKQLANAVDMLLRQQNLSFQDSDAVAAALDHFRKRPSLGFSDCMIVEAARKAGHIPIGTFDRDMAKLPDTARL
jgi:predicted nucleic-acid-binding protein